MRFVDYHVHSLHSICGKSTIFEMCRKAIELGLVEIGFSDHMEFEPKERGYGFFNYDNYSSEIESARSLFKDKLVIRKGVEIGYQYCFEEEIKKWLRNKEFDFIIGAVHYLNHEFISHQLVARSDLKEIYEAYFDEVAQSIESCLFHVIGHFDYVSKYIDNRTPELHKFNHQEAVRKLMEKMVEKKKYLEQNSKLSVPKGTHSNILSSMEIFWEYIKSGGKLISIGSDAHSTEKLGIGIKEMLDNLEKFNGKMVKFLFE
jgi:histidinol-phosphatase (PHP family)